MTTSRLPTITWIALLAPGDANAAPAWEAAKASLSQAFNASVLDASVAPV